MGCGPADKAGGRGCAAEPQALTSTCSRQPPSRLRESSLVSTAACGPGCSQGQRGLVTCWPFMCGLANGGDTASCTPQGRLRKGSALRCAGMWTPSCAPTPTQRGHTHAHMLTCALSLHTGKLQVSYELRTQKHTEAQTQTDPCVDTLPWPQNRHVNVCLKYMCPKMGSLPRTHAASTPSSITAFTYELWAGVHW